MEQQMIDETIKFFREHQGLLGDKGGEILCSAFLHKILEKASEKFRKDRTSVSLQGKKLVIVSGEYGLLAKRTASNAYDILLLNREEYNKYLEDKEFQDNYPDHSANQQPRS